MRFSSSVAAGQVGAGEGAEAAQPVPVTRQEGAIVVRHSCTGAGSSGNAKCQWMGMAWGIHHPPGDNTGFMGSTAATSQELLRSSRCPDGAM